MINAAGRPTGSSVTGGSGGLTGRLHQAVGGPARLRVILLLSATLALAAADQTIAGAVAPDLKVAVEADNTQIGLLVTAASLMAAVTTLPFGLLADRTARVRLLAACALAWSASIGLAGSAHSYTTVLIAQILLGAGVGAATPVVASLTGDLFPTADRGRALGFILAGEFAGAASGLLIAGEVAAVWSWRGSYWVLAVAGPVLALALMRLLPEPERGGSSRVPVGARQIGGVGAGNGKTDDPAPVDAGAGGDGGDETRDGGDDGDGRAAPARRADLIDAVTAARIEPRRSLVLTEDPTGRSLRWAVRYVLSIPTNVVIIVASALGYFYVAGLQTFAIVYLRGKFDIGQGVATALLVGVGVGVIGGTLVTGGVSDRLIARRHIAARPVVGAACFLLAVVFLVPGFLLSVAIVALPLLFLGAAAIGGVNAPLDAARLDVMHSRLWGRAESVRNFWQTLLKSSAPLIFGYLSTVLADGQATNAEQGGGAVGLQRAFVVLLALLLVAAIVLVVARRTYPRDVATAMASEAATRTAQK